MSNSNNTSDFLYIFLEAINMFFEVTDDINSAILLMAIKYYTKEGANTISYPTSTWFELCRLTPSQFEMAINNLTNIGYINTKMELDENRVPVRKIKLLKAYFGWEECYDDYRNLI